MVKNWLVLLEVAFTSRQYTLLTNRGLGRVVFGGQAMKARGVGEGGQVPLVALFSISVSVKSSSSSALEVDSKKFLKRKVITTKF